jgi:hypothetical protein
LRDVDIPISEASSDPIGTWSEQASNLSGHGSASLMALMPRCSSDPADKPTPKIVDGLTILD